MSRASVLQRHVVVDMTPLEPGGRNGGAGLVATSLVQHMAAQAPWLDFTLLTAQASHAELARLDAPNVHRQCVVAQQPARSLARTLVNTVLPPGARVQLKQALYSLRTSRRYRQMTSDLQPDLLFCPFSVPYFWRPGMRCVSIVYDLQHVSYPEFFSVEQRLNRQRHLEQACARSNRVVCISEYVRKTLLAAVEVNGEQVRTIPLGLLQDGPSPDPQVVARLGLSNAEFLLYPANFWPHKNHRVLFDALRIYRQTHPHSKLRLVCTGAPNPLMHKLAQQVASEPIVFAGYVSPESLVALLDASAALIFPSLYEGFGMPVLEAMARGRPVLCSDVTSLPEVGGQAAVYFNPRDPVDIARAMAVLHDQVHMANLVACGRARAKLFGTASDMAARYLDLFVDVLATRE